MVGGGYTADDGHGYAADKSRVTRREVPAFIMPA